MIMRTLFLTVLGSIMLFMTACSTPSGDAANGKRWFLMHNCWACHGRNANNGKAPDISGIDMSFNHFLSTIRDAGSPIMPKFSEETISKQDAADIYAWLKTK